MEGVDHVDIVQVGCCCFVGDVHWMFQGQVPNGECLELGVTGTDAALVLVVELRQTCRHLAAARTWCRHDDKLTARLNIVVLAKPLVGGYQLDVVGIAVDGVVDV